MPLHHRRSRLLGVLVTAFLLISGLGSCSTEEDFTSDSFRNFDVLWETLDRNYCYFGRSGAASSAPRCPATRSSSS